MPAPKKEPALKQTLSRGLPPRLKRPDMVAEHIKRLILAQDLKPGDHLPKEKELIRLFGCSRGTIRESLKSLEVQGLVEIVSGPDGGARVCAVPYHRAMQLLCNYLHFQSLSGDQIYQVRRLAEVLLAESVVGRLSEADFQALDRTIETSRRFLTDRTETFDCRAAELEFHNVLAQACPNPFLAFLCRFMNDILLYFVAFKGYSNEVKQEFRESTLAFHVELVAAFRAQDREEVRRLMGLHMDDAASFVAALEAALGQGLIPKDNAFDFLNFWG